MQPQQSEAETILFCLCAVKYTVNGCPREREASSQWGLASRVTRCHHPEPLSSCPQRLVTVSMAKVTVGEASSTPSETFESGDDGSCHESLLTLHLPYDNTSHKAG